MLMGRPHVKNHSRSSGGFRLKIFRTNIVLVALGCLYVLCLGWSWTASVSTIADQSLSFNTTLSKITAAKSLEKSQLEGLQQPSSPGKRGNARNSKTTTTMSGESKLKTHSEAHFVNYQLYLDKPYNVTFGPFTKCPLGVTTNKWGRKPIERVPLHSSFNELLKVTTYLQTNLKILSLGDSVGMQFHQLLEEAVGATPDHRTLYEFAWGEHESVSVAAPVAGGGVVGAFRMTGMLLASGKGKPPPNKSGGGWLPSHIQELLNHTYLPTTTITSSTQHQTVQSFDVMLFRIPHGWLRLDEITEKTLTESLELAHELFGVKTVIVFTLPLNNNVKTMDELDQLHRTNDMIRDVVHSWKDRSHSSGISNVLLLEFANFESVLTHRNAELAGMDQTSANYTLERLACAKYPPSKAMICTNIVKHGSCTCRRNRISIDGMHWCMESIGGRVIGGIACLLQCWLDREASTVGLETCEATCNQRFMSLDPISIDE